MSSSSKNHENQGGLFREEGLADLPGLSAGPTEGGAESAATGPLANRMRPRGLDELFGQESLLAPGKPLRTWIERDQLPSLILWGPPGCGKTSLARAIAQATKARFEGLSAVLSGVKDLKEVVERAKRARDFHGERTLLFVDEIHRFNKTQQDALLPHVEEGTLTLIGATTENPSFELNSALLSRARVVRLESLSEAALVSLLKRALTDPVRGLGGWFAMDDASLTLLARASEGDARRALGLLEQVSFSLATDGVTSPSLDEAGLKELLGRIGIKTHLRYDSSGEEHYNVISAFIKSIRDSDPHAGLYYLARMLEGGEDPLFIARRLVILASEDVGNADPRALTMAISAKEAIDFVGMPEARITLAQAVTYIATAPKSNAAYAGIGEAMAEVQRSGALEVPFHLRNAVTSLMRREGYGQGYQYAHNDASQRAKQTHLPKDLVGKRFYDPKEVGYEKWIKERLDLLNPDFDGGKSSPQKP